MVMSKEGARAQRRSKGKRQLKRECRRDVVRILELDTAGYSVETIASRVGLAEDFVKLVLEKALEAGGRGRR